MKALGPQYMGHTPKKMKVLGSPGIIYRFFFKDCFNTPLEHTPKGFTKRLKVREFFQNWLRGIADWVC